MGFEWGNTLDVHKFRGYFDEIMRYRFVDSMEKYEVCFTGIYR